MPGEETVTSAPAASSAPAPASSAPAAPSSAPASTSAPSTAPATSTPSTPAPAAPASVHDALKTVKRSDYPDTYAYSEALNKAREAAEESGLPVELEEAAASTEDPAPVADATVDPAADPAATVKTPEEIEAEAKAAQEELDKEFNLEEPSALEPEALSAMLRENEEFRAIVEADPKLKGQLYKTAREAAALKPYRELFPDVESAKIAAETSTQFNDLRGVFMTSTTREGAMATLSQIAQLCGEVDDQGAPVLDAQGHQIIGEDFYGFVDNVIAIDLANRRQQVEERLEKNLYRSDEEREKDEQRLSAMNILKGEDSPAPAASGELPEALKAKAAEIEREHAKLNDHKTAEQKAQHQAYEQGVKTASVNKLKSNIDGIIESVVRQGAVIAPFVREALPEKIGAKFVARMKADKVLGAQLEQMARELPATEAAKNRRLARFQTAVETYLPDIAREVLREAGVQPKASQDAKSEKVAAQIANSRSEPRGSTGPAAPGQPMDAQAARDKATAEWRQKNPGRSQDRFAQQEILTRAVQLQLGQ